MKTLIKTSIIVLALIGLMALAAGTAAASPQMDMPWDHEQVIDPSMLARLQDMNLEPDEDFVVPPEEQVIPDGGGDECVGCDEEDVDDGDDEGIDDGQDEGVDDGQDEQVPDDGDDDGVVDEEETPPLDGGDSGKTDEEQKPPATSTSSGKQLPNTGTQLAVIGGIGLLIALTAFGTRMVLKKRMR